MEILAGVGTSLAGVWWGENSNLEGDCGKDRLWWGNWSGNFYFFGWGVCGGVSFWSGSGEGGDFLLAKNRVGMEVGRENIGTGVK